MAPIGRSPTPEALRIFFRERRPQEIQAAATLLGWRPTQVEQRATSDEIPLRDGLVPWPHVASWLFETWTYEWVMLVLGPETELLPPDLRAVPVLWVAPAWIVKGLNVQREIDGLPHRTVRPISLSEYLTDLLARH